MAFKYKISKIAEICRAKSINSNNVDLTVSNVLTDSRSNFTPEGTIFFALKGDRNNGHNYIDDLIDNGVTCFVTEYLPEPKEKYKNINFIIVDDTIDALHKFAAFHRDRFKISIAGITGSNGKTIVKEWLSQLMEPEHNICRSPLSYNSQIGVPLSVLQLHDEHTIALFEAGISKPNEMRKLQNIIKPDIGIFTGIGTAHDENFSSKKEKIEEKLKLFNECKALICYSGDSLADKMIIDFVENHNIRLFTVSDINKNADVQIDHVKTEKQKATFKAVFKGKEQIYEIPFSDNASLMNSFLSLGVLLFLNYDQNIATERLGMLEPVAMRMEQIEGVQNCIIINDSYNNDLLALRVALDHLSHIHSREKKCIVLSDIFQTGLDPETIRKQVADLINRYSPDKFIGIGDVMSGLKGHLKCKEWYYPTTEKFIKYHPFSTFKDEIILLKGARNFKFENVRDALQKKSHDTILEINLSAIVHNLNYFRSLLEKKTKIMAMVKASSYGGGNFEIASMLQYHKVDYLAVAYADEGVELRKAGIKIPVMVMNPEPASFDLIIENNLEPEIYNFRILELFTKALEKRDITTMPPWNVHIEIDTGMHRLGFDPEELDELIECLNKSKTVKAKSVFSHLATADDNNYKEFAKKQINLFCSIRKKILSELLNKPLFHILNSAGIINFPNAQFDMVRPGIGLYGVSHDIDVQKELRHVGRLISVVSQIRYIKTGDSVGYNCSFVAQEDMKIATVAIGYADGFNRKLGNGNGAVRINGIMAPVVGDVCMDMIMVDITNINNVEEGTEVIVFDELYPVNQIAKILQTIPYEILTSVSSRVKRIYLTE